MMVSDLDLLNSSEENLKWFQENSHMIIEKYAKMAIALKDKKIISSKKNLNELISDLKSKNIDDSEVLIEIIPSPNEIKIL